MFKFLKTKTPLCYPLQFRKFAAAILFCACFSNATLNVSTASNAEIADFIKSESEKTLQIPDSSVLTLNFQTAKDNHRRAGLFFFWGERDVSINADYILLLKNSEQLKGTIKADTSWYTGYCGMIECQAKPMPAQQRIDVLKDQVQKILTELNGKLELFNSSSNSSVAATPANNAADTFPTPNP